MVSRTWVGIVAVLFPAFAVVASPHAGAMSSRAHAAANPGARQAVTADPAITLDGTSAGRLFDGVGALSAGASSRLLTDYPPQQRSQILDYLFKPGYGASLQILKVEIGGDTNSTDGSEPSHMRTPSDLNCNRGYEWWLMEQAKARNPDIKLYGLQWGAPGWVGSGGTLWTQDDVNYQIAWLGCARQHGLHIDYIGGWNEKGYNQAYYEELHQALAANGYDTKVVAADSFGWDVASSMASDPAFNSSVDIVGVHYPCGYLSTYTSCPSTATAQGLGKPLWASEQGSLTYDSGAAPLARAINRAYIDGKMTSSINWSLIASWYNTLPFQGDGLMAANQPWSGAYTVGQSIWVTAHTAQFTQPGWRYLDSASGYFPTSGGGGGSYVTLRSPSTGDYSVVAETLDATAPQQVTFNATGGLSGGPVHVWATNLGSPDPGQWFVHAGDVTPSGGSYTVTLQPGHVYTLSTTTGQGKGGAVSPQPRPWALPYSDSFDSYPSGAAPKYLSDLDGAFETAPCEGGRSGQCLRQVISQQPVDWNGLFDYPVTVIGDPASWRNYTTSVDTHLGNASWVELLGRMDGQYQSSLSGIHLRLNSDGSWQLYDETLTGGQTANAALCGPSDPSCPTAAGAHTSVRHTTLASGHLAPATGSASPSTGAAASVASGWRRLGLRFSGDTVTAYVDGKSVASINDGTHATGQAGLAVSPWHNAEFDNLSVTPAPQQPSTLHFLPGEQMTASATSYHMQYEPRNAVDGSVQSIWHTEYSPKAPLPQSITIGLGGQYKVGEVTYQPREDGNTNGIITGYVLSVSNDGTTFTPVASGTWSFDDARKQIVLPPTQARYIRLTAEQAGGGYASAAEIQVGAY
jgi:Glycosyl hydrolase family 59/F5/8 type C domain